MNTLSVSSTNDNFMVVRKKIPMRKSLSCTNFGCPKEKLSEMKKSISLDSLTDCIKPSSYKFKANLDSIQVDDLKHMASHALKANVPGVIYDIAKDTITQVDSNAVDIQHVVIDHITQDAIVSTVTHIFKHHL